ncbi:MFS transporter-like protein [Rostrohypoxylon terebratum]|nr:MFS transporter-like protein [Rostrohypoxylon terebratum]
MPPSNPPFLSQRSSTLFILSTITVGLFTDLFLYSLVVPVLPFLLRDRLSIPQSSIQSYVSNLLAAYAGASVVSSVPAGWVADWTRSRRAPFLSGLAAMLAATVMLAFGRSVAVLFVARVLQGVSAAVVWTVGFAMVLDTVGPQNLGKVVGSIFSFISLGGLIAPVVGGVLYEKTGYAGVFGVAAGMLGLDFVMRLLVIEKKAAAKYDEIISSDPDRDSVSQIDGAEDFNDEESPTPTPTESSALLPNNPGDSPYKIHKPLNRLTRTLPILLCFRNPRLLVGCSLSLVQASLLGLFDATIPTEAASLFNFTSLQAGLLFITLELPYLLLGPVAGWAVDRYGTKFASVLGFGCLVPALILLRLPSSHLVSGPSNVALYCAVLALNGVGLALIGSPGVVEASFVVQEYDRANPGLFGANGPYAQLYGFNSLFFCAGLTVGPLVAGALRDGVGYGNMNLVFGIISGVTAVVSFFVVGGKPNISLHPRSWGKGRAN